MKNRSINSQSENIPEFPLAEEMPYWDFSDDENEPWISLVDGTLVKGLRLKGVAIETLDTDSINRLTAGLRSFLNSLPDGIEVQFFVEVNSDFSGSLEEHEALSGDNALIKWVAESRYSQIRHQIESGALKKTNLYLFVYERNKVSTSSITSFFKKAKNFQSVRNTEHEKRLRNLNQKITTISENLKSVGIKNDLIPVSIMKDLVYRFLNPKRACSSETPKLSNEHRSQEFAESELKLEPALSLPSPREQLVFSSFVQSVESFEFDGIHHRLITLKTLPELTHASLMSKLMKLRVHHFLSLQIKVPEQSKEISSIQSKRRMAHSMSVTHGGRASDLESEARLQSTEELLREVLNTGQKIFYFQVAVLISDKSKEELKQKTEIILSQIRTMSGAEGTAETVANFKVFKTILPAGNTALVRPKRIKSDNLADFLPIYQDFEGESKAVCLFQSRSGGLIKYDPFYRNLTNYNVLVTGASGSGKSFLNNCILLQSLTQKPLVYIIDIGGSYRKLCEFMGGQYIEMSPPVGNDVGTSSINPFLLPESDKFPTPHKIKFLLSLLELMLSENDDTKLPKLSRALLEEAIIKTYEKLIKTQATPTLSDLVATLRDSHEPELHAFAKMLYPWTGSRAYGRLLDGNGGLALNSDFVVFDLQSLENYPDLQSVMILIITDFILGKVESEKHRTKQILMDECWKLLKSSSSSEFMEYCARTIRKKNGQICFITQGLQEIIQSPIGAAILNNTATKFILNQQGDLEPTRNILKLNDQEMGLISSLTQSKGNYSEAFMIAGDDRTVIRISPTSLEYWLATSDANDNGLLSNVRLRYPKMPLPEILHYLAINYPKGSMGVQTLPEINREETV